MVELPRKSVSVEVEWMDGLPADPDDGFEATRGGWHLSVKVGDEFLPITDHEWPAAGYETVGEAVTAVEKWATDRNMSITDTSFDIICWPNVKETT